MIKLNIKPLSVNQAWQGKRFKTPKYKAFQTLMLHSLPKLKDKPSGALKVTLHYTKLEEAISKEAKIHSR